MDIAIIFNNVITQLIAKKSLEKNISDQTPILKSHTARSAYFCIFFCGICVVLLHHIHLHHVRPAALMDRHARQTNEDVTGLHMSVALQNL